MKIFFQSFFLYFYLRKAKKKKNVWIKLKTITFLNVSQKIEGNKSISEEREWIAGLGSRHGEGGVE